MKLIIFLAFLALSLVTIFFFAACTPKVSEPDTIPAPWGAVDFCNRNPEADRCPD